MAVDVKLLHIVSDNNLIKEALPGVLGNRGNRAFISGEHGNKGQISRGTEEQRQDWGTGNIRKQIFNFWGTGEQANSIQGDKGTGTPLGGSHQTRLQVCIVPVSNVAASKVYQFLEVLFVL